MDLIGVKMYIRARNEYKIATKGEIYKEHKFLLNKGKPWDLVALVQNGILILTGKDQGTFIPSAYINGCFPNKKEQEKLFVAAEFMLTRRMIYSWSNLFIWIAYILTVALVSNITWTEEQIAYVLPCLATLFIFVLPYCIFTQIKVQTDIISIEEREWN